MGTNRGVRARNETHRVSGNFEYYCSPSAKESATGSTLETPEPSSRFAYYVSPSEQFARTTSENPSSPSTWWSRVSGLNTSRDVISHGCSIVENLLGCGEKVIARNLFDKMDREDGYEEIQYPDLKPYVEVLGEHYTSRRTEEDASLLETQCGATSKTGWKKNRTDAEKKADMVDPRFISPAVDKINNCENNCGKTFIVSQVKTRELEFNDVMRMRKDFVNLTNVEMKAKVTKLFEASAEPPFHLEDEGVTARLCTNCVALYYDRPLSTLNHWRVQCHAGEVSGGQQVRQTRDEGIKTTQVRNYISWFIGHFGTLQKAHEYELPGTSVYSDSPEMYLVDKYSTAELYSKFMCWVDQIYGEGIISVSDRWVKKQWDARLATDEPCSVRVRLNTGREGGCGICARLFLAFKNALRKDKPECMAHRMQHRKHVANQRVYHSDRMLQNLNNPNIEEMVQDGFDTWKCGVPLYGLAPPDHINFKPYASKISGVINFGKQCTFVLTPPWVLAGGNLSVTSFMANMAVRVQSCARSGTEMPEVLRLLIDGGSENWSYGWFTFGGWLVGSGMFKEVIIQRLPAHHGYNGMDAKFAPASTFFYGTKNNRVAGKNIHSMSEYLIGLNKAYEKHVKGTVLGGPPVVLQTGCAYDWTSFIAPYVDSNYHGWGHSEQEWFDEFGARVTGKRGSTIHYLHFFEDTLGDVRLRYKNAATYPDSTWMPVHRTTQQLPDGKAPIGIKPFNCKAAALPRHKPGWDEFKEWDTDGKIKNSILRIHGKDAAFMPAAAHTEWETTFDSLPQTPQDVPAEQQPVWGFFSRGKTAPGSQLVSGSHFSLCVNFFRQQW